MATRTLHLVRHGQYHANQSHPLSGHLTQLGQLQVEYAALSLRGLHPEVIVQSPLDRARESADIIAEVHSGIRRRTARLLAECFPFVPRMHYLQIPELADWTQPELVAAFTLSPKLLEQAQARFEEVADIPIRFKFAESCFRSFCKPVRRGPDRQEILVTHGNLIRYLACRAMKMPPDLWLSLTIHNAGITRIAIEPDGFVNLISFNEIGHLPQNLQTIG